ncbi:MAG TPA: hypothetical protein VEG61_04220 [Candidatus Dormibacteraeota bacterium]|nr:hypothetical protein [Candidatus Dormibacteraeota bacterium]
MMKKPVFGPKRVGFLGTIILTGISWTVIWVPILSLRLQVMLTRDLFSLVVFFTIVYAPLWVVAQVLTKYLIWRGRSQV